MASRSVNRVILLGNLGKPAETKFTPSGIAKTTFSVATSTSWKDKQSGEWREKTEWTNVVVWRQEKLADHLTKGARVYVEGRLETRSWDGNDGHKKYITEVVADDVILFGGESGRRESKQNDWNEQDGVSSPARQSRTEIDDDSVPF